jgi:hypothetical protein
MKEILVYNKIQINDGYVDWFDYPFKNQSEFKPSHDLEACLAQPFSIATLPFEFEDLESYKLDPIDYQKFDLLLISDIETNHINEIHKWIDKMQIRNYLLAFGSMENFEIPANALYRPWWMFNIVNQNTFQDTNNRYDKPFDFDVLLGARKPHRDYVMAKMQTTGLINNSIVNYRDLFTAPKYDDNTNLEIEKILNGQDLLYPYVSANMKPEWEVRDTLERWVSEIIPWKMYEQTKYSLVCETHGDYATFVTEKTAKPIFAKRLFITFSSPEFLKFLRKLGFETFGQVIDETYDKLHDPAKRFHYAWKQVEALQKENYRSVYEKIKPVLEHNHNRLHELKQEIQQQMYTMVYNKIEETKC